MMTQRSSKFTNKPFSLKEVIVHAIAFRPMTTQGKRLFLHYGEAVERCHEIYREMQHVSKQYLFFDIDFSGPPDVLGFNGGRSTQLQMEKHLDRFASELASQWDHPRIGRIDWQGPKECAASYCEFERKNGLLTNQLSVAKVTHHIVDAKYHKLPALHVEQPRRARQIARTLNFLKPHARIITGMEVGHQSEQVEDLSERTMLGRGVDNAISMGKAGAAGARRFGPHALGVAAAGTAVTGIAAAGPAIAAALPTVAAAAGVTAAAAAGAGMLAVLVLDPVLIVGDRVLVGWE